MNKAELIAEQLRESINIVKVNKTIITPEMYGAVGDGIHDDTWAVQKAFDACTGKKLIFNGNYAVTSVTAKYGADSVIDFNGHKLIALSNLQQDCVLKIQTHFCTWYDIFVEVRFKENYKCGTHIVPEVVGGVPTYVPQYNNFFGYTVSMAVIGTVYGVYEGEVSTFCAASENVFYGLKGYSLNIPFYVNQKGAYFTMIGCTFEANMGGWASVVSPTRFDDTKSCCFRCDVGVVNIVASEIVKADTANGYGIWGQGINISNSTWEVGGVQGNIFGDVTIRDNVDGYIGNGSLNYFIVQPNTVGNLIIENCTFHRPTGSESFVDTVLFYSVGAPFFKIKLKNVNLTHTKFNVQFIKGLDFELENVRFAPSGTFGQQSDGVANVNDINEYYMSTHSKAVDISEKMTDIPLNTTITTRSGNWIVYNETGTNNAQYIKRITTNLPPNASGLYVIELQGADSWSGVRTPVFRVEESEIFAVSLIAKCTGSGSSSIVVKFLDANRAAVSEIAYDNLTSTFNRYNYFCKVPANAKYCYVRITNNISQLTHFTDFKVYGIKHDPIIRKSAAPSSGFWDKGEIVYNDSPANLGYIGWVCTAEPSTFIRYGLITT
jgi:hypothetical protein